MLGVESGFDPTDIYTLVISGGVNQENVAGKALYHAFSSGISSERIFGIPGNDRGVSEASSSPVVTFFGIILAVASLRLEITFVPKPSSAYTFPVKNPI